MRTNRARRVRGVVLATSLILLVVLTVIAITVFKGFGVLQLIAGNAREKQRSLESAQSGLAYGEWFLKQGIVGVGVPCTSAAYPAFAATAGVGICADALPNPTTVPWSGGFGNLGSMVAFPGMTISTTGGVGTFYADPKVYIQYIGLTQDGKMNPMFQVTAAGWGGNANAVSVVQSTYVLVNNNVDAGNP
ncbi:MAG: pilus assembly protein PilX [Burkholderiales bacterium]|nr:pilus assembly protein PilX [Burkholderiales bacterium]MDE1928351.1 pilus assembly protein PilX [Burkholderiales bacterium]MDE2157767.1 pilus assembly protein PilX [Burkholderiales bacterium]MDE2502161.1 pilus assembly protein PilX [Burkholderiales bacterium]